MSRRPLTTDLGIALIVAILILVLTPGVAVAGMIALLVLAACVVTLGERPLDHSVVFGDLVGIKHVESGLGSSQRGRSALEPLAIAAQQVRADRAAGREPPDDRKPDLRRTSDQQHAAGRSPRSRRRASGGGRSHSGRSSHSSPVRSARSERQRPHGSAWSRARRHSPSRGYIAVTASGRNRASLLK